MNKSEVFWRAHCKTKPSGKDFFSSEFKELIVSMMALDPNQRPTMDQIMASDWVNGNLPSDKEIQKELEQRNEQVVAAMQEEKQANKQQKEQRTSNYIATRRSGGEEEKGEAEFLVPQKELLEYHAD